MMIEKKGDSIILSLNKDFYNDTAIDSVMRNFAEVCEIEREDSDGYYIVHLNGEGAEEIALEFANHVLALMKVV